MLKLGGSVLTDKAGEPKFRRPAAKRLFGEVARAEVPVVLLHGAGSFGHGPAKRHGLGERHARPEAVSEILASVMRLHADVVQVAADAGLRPLSFPVHHTAVSEGGRLVDLPVDRIARALDEGHMPVLCGTLVRDDALGWRVVSADELMAELAPELDPRLAAFASDVDGVMGPDGLLERLGPGDLDRLVHMPGVGPDVTGGMVGKLGRAFQVAACCPTWIINGDVRGRLQDLLKGKPVPGTRVEA